MLRPKSMGVSPSSNVTDNGRLQAENRSTNSGEFSLLLAATLLHFAQAPMVYGNLYEDGRQRSFVFRRSALQRECHRLTYSLTPVAFKFYVHQNLKPPDNSTFLQATLFDTHLEDKTIHTIPLGHCLALSPIS